MNIINQSVKEYVQSGFTKLEDICFHIERCGRVSYKSEDKITDTSALPFVKTLINNKHLSPLEHATIYLHFHGTRFSQAMKNKIAFYSYNPYSFVCKVDHYSPSSIFGIDYIDYYITTNYRVIIENNREDDLHWQCEPTDNHEKRRTFHIITNRQVSHEFVRHRVLSFTQESTRFNNYAKGKFNNELTFIAPMCKNERTQSFNKALSYIESVYMDMIKEGASAQEAAQILPNATKTELVATGTENQWKAFLTLRDSDAAHPQMREVAQQIKELL